VTLSRPKGRAATRAKSTVVATHHPRHQCLVRLTPPRGIVGAGMRTLVMGTPPPGVMLLVLGTPFAVVLGYSAA